MTMCCGTLWRINCEYRRWVLLLQWTATIVVDCWTVCMVISSPLLSIKQNNVNTDNYAPKCKHEYVTESGVFARRGDYFAYRYDVTSKCAKINAEMSVKTTDDTLQPAIVKCPSADTAPPFWVVLDDIRRPWKRSTPVATIDVGSHRQIHIAYEQSVWMRCWCCRHPRTAGRCATCGAHLHTIAFQHDRIDRLRKTAITRQHQFVKLDYRRSGTRGIKVLPVAAIDVDRHPMITGVDPHCAQAVCSDAVTML